MLMTFKSYCFLWRKRAIVCLVLVCAMLTLLLVGCASITKEEKTLRIGLAVYQQDDTFINTIVQNMEKYAREAEGISDVKINIIVLDGQSNQTVQLEQVSRLLEQGCNVLCVNIVDRTAAAVIVDKAEKANVPLVFFNRQPVEEDILRWENTYYVGVKAEQSGMMQGEIVRDIWEQNREKVDKNGDDVLQYIMLEGEPGHQDALLRTQYSVQALHTSNIKVEKLASQTANWKRGEAATLMADYILEFNGEIEAVFANNDDMALGAQDAYINAGYAIEDMPIMVGVDAIPQALDAIANGSLSGTVLNDSEGIAYAMIDLSLALYNNENPENAVNLQDGHYVWLPSVKITKQQLDENNSIIKK